jgi:hypothetical protein
VSIVEIKKGVKCTVCGKEHIFGGFKSYVDRTDLLLWMNHHEHRCKGAHIDPTTEEPNPFLAAMQARQRLNDQPFTACSSKDAEISHLKDQIIELQKQLLEAKR